MFFFIMIGSYLYLQSYLKNEIIIFLKNQQNNLKKQNLSIIFQPSTLSSWKIWPQIVLIYPTIQKNTSTAPQTVWKTKQATISYSLWHPLNLIIKLDGEQLFCPKNQPENCFQLHGSPWIIYVPLTENHKKTKFSLKIKEIFYAQVSRSIWDFHSIKLKNIQANFQWNHQANIDETIAFSSVYVKQAFVDFTTVPLQKINNILLQAALIKKEKASDLSNDFYKILLQKINFSWNKLSIDISGKLNLLYPNFIPTGEASLHLDGINQTIYEALASLNCCTKLKEELSQTSLPSHLDLTILIREGVFYLGVIPLKTIWYDRFKILFSTYTK